MVTLTSNIGIGVLRSALRLVENHVEINEVDVIDSFASGCGICEHQYDSESCYNCEHKILKSDIVKKYVNEKNKYGERKVLKRNALLLFMYLHFLDVDDRGYSRVNIEEAADIIHCDTKTIRNNLRLLKNHNYILLCETETPGFYQFFITDYKNYFKKANEGGRGYVTLSKDFFIKLTSLKDINSIRLVLRSFLYSVENGTKTYAKKERTYKEVKRELPVYCTKETISNIMSGEDFTSIFDVVKKKFSVVLEVKSEFNPKHVVSEIKNKCRERVMAFIMDKNNKRKSGQPFMIIKPQDMKHIMDISLRYSLDAILKSLETFYNDYILAGLEVKSIGALIRTIVSENAQFEACL